VGSIVTIIGCVTVVTTSLCIGIKKVIGGIQDCFIFCCQRIYWPMPRCFASVDARDEFKINVTQRQGGNIDMIFHIPKDDEEEKSDATSKVELLNLKKKVNLIKFKI